MAESCGKNLRCHSSRDSFHTSDATGGIWNCLGAIWAPCHAASHQQELSHTCTQVSHFRRSPIGCWPLCFKAYISQQMRYGDIASTASCRKLVPLGAVEGHTEQYILLRTLKSNLKLVKPESCRSEGWGATSSAQPGKGSLLFLSSIHMVSALQLQPELPLSPMCAELSAKIS